MRINLKVFLVLAVLISSNSFYNFSLFGVEADKIYKLLHYLFFLLIVCYLCVKNVNRKSKIKNVLNKHQTRIGKCVSLLIFGQIVALFNATIFKEQPLSVSLVTSLPMLIACLSYYIFRKISLTEEEDVRVIIIMGVIFCIVFSLSVITLPQPLFGTFEFDEDRGGFRFRINGINWTCLLLFYLIDRLKVEKKRFYLLLVLILYLFVVASLTRQLIFWTTLMGVGLLIRGMRIKKLLMVVSFIIILGVTVIPQIPLVQNLVEVTEMQKEQNDSGKEDVRLLDYPQIRNL